MNVLIMGEKLKILHTQNPLVSGIVIFALTKRMQNYAVKALNFNPPYIRIIKRFK